MIAPRTTLADNLRYALSRLDEQIPASNNNTNLYKAWQGVLGGPGRSEDQVLLSLTDLLRAFEKLETQVVQSQSLDEDLKGTCLQITESFKPLFRVLHLSQAAFNYKSLCSKQSVGQLALVGRSIQSEFSEPKLSSVDAEGLLAAFKEIRTLLDVSQLPPDTTVSLIRHIDALIWWMSHPDMASIHDVFERAGTAVVVAGQLESQASSTEAVEKSQGISSKIKAAGATLWRLAGYAGQANERLDQIEGAVHHVMKLTGHG